ncbi:MAG: COX15/CtaA family protein [Hyphomonadaceae bacterium]|nr:COX15/CtaA family protein [Hyphomonadaceae bacterium]
MSAAVSEKNVEPLAAAWFATLATLVVAMILVGGATRLTDSGLSITEWDLGKGLTPPLTAARWAEEFALYRQTAEYQLQNAGMSLAAFQTIYWWEWGHRFLGKVVGVVWAAPFVVLLATGRLRGRVGAALALGALGGLQGAIGWWMVVSGLEGRLDVSPHRLATHLGMAFVILGFALALTLDAAGARRNPGRLGAPRWAALGFVGLLFAQIVVGALTAGADAGRAYDDWPTIGGAWLPIAEPLAQLQFAHRTLGYAVGLAALALAAAAWRGGQGRTRIAALHVGALALVQVALGVAAVVTGAHLAISLIHQAGAILLWGAAVATAAFALSNPIPHSQAIENKRTFAPG